MATFLSTLCALLAVLLAVWAFLPTPPHPPSRPVRGAKYESPGPVLASRVENLVLDGLTIIPIARLPRLKTRLHIPFSRYSLALSLDLTSSETVLSRLRIGSATVRGRDIMREAVSVQARGVEVAMQGSIGARVEICLLGSGDKQPKWSWRKGSAGRAQVAFEGAATEAKVQVVGGPASIPFASSPATDDAQETALTPKLSLLASSFSPGNTTLLSLSPSFLPFLPTSLSSFLFSTIVPSARNSPIARSANSHLVSFLLRELLEGHVLDELLADLERFAGKHVDGAMYGGIVDSERERVLAAFFRTPNYQAEQQHTAQVPGPPPLVPPPSDSLPPSGGLRFSSIVHGPTLLHSLSLPAPPSTFLPVFSRSSASAGGLRHTLLSSPILNQITTGPPSVDLGTSEFERVGWSSARIELAQPSRSSTDNDARELVLSVDSLDALLSTQFTISSTLRTAPSLLLGGLRDLVEPGSTSTSVTSALIRIHLPLAFLPSSPSGWRVEVGGKARPGLGAGDGTVRMEGGFDKIHPKIRLESRLLGKVGEKVVNGVLEGVKALFAPLAPPLLSFFLADLARLRLQQVLDDVCGRVRDEGGVEFAMAAAETSEKRTGAAGAG
ncbi:hypothetical protein JCM11641_001801 [Rhodosporidiobolus odoratus]